jgi:hypothetical protein
MDDVASFTGVTTGTKMSADGSPDRVDDTGS